MTLPPVALVSNAGTTPWPVWIEPWCDELTLPPRSTLGFSLIDAPDPEQPPEIEINDDGMLVVWQTSPGRAIFTIDGTEQDTGSKVIPLPAELLDMPVKRFVQIAFGNFPEARPGGASLAAERNVSWWRRIVGRLRR